MFLVILKFSRKQAFINRVESDQVLAIAFTHEFSHFFQRPVLLSSGIPRIPFAWLQQQRSCTEQNKRSKNSFFGLKTLSKLPLFLSENSNVCLRVNVQSIFRNQVLREPVYNLILSEGERKNNGSFLIINKIRWAERILPQFRS